MAMYDSNDRTNEFIARAQAQMRRSWPGVTTPQMLDRELRRRRKNYLCSHISVWSLVEKGGVVANEDVDALADCFVRRTLLFWNRTGEDAESYCYHFYHLTLFGLLSGEIRECIDDLIQLSGALVRSREVFRIAMQDIVPPEMFAELFHFVEDYDDDFYTPHFEDAVLYAVASFLGTLKIPGTHTNDVENEGLGNGD